MECGAYNSDSLCSPGHTSGQASEQEAERRNSDMNGGEESDSTAEEGMSDKQPLVFTHLKVCLDLKPQFFKIFFSQKLSKPNTGFFWTHV